MSFLIEYSITNNFKKSDEKNKSCFQFDIKPSNCENPNVLWGSEKPLGESCKPENLQLEGAPCMNIWNNSTKRKTIVNDKYIG